MDFDELGAADLTVTLAIPAGHGALNVATGVAGGVTNITRQRHRTGHLGRPDRPDQRHLGGGDGRHLHGAQRRLQRSEQRRPGPADGCDQRSGPDRRAGGVHRHGSGADHGQRDQRRSDHHGPGADASHRDRGRRGSARGVLGGEQHADRRGGRGSGRIRRQFHERHDRGQQRDVHAGHDGGLDQSQRRRHGQSS